MYLKSLKKGKIVKARSMLKTNKQTKQNKTKKLAYSMTLIILVETVRLQGHVDRAKFPPNVTDCSFPI